MRIALVLLASLPVLLCAGGAAAGPWPQAAGEGFAAVTPRGDAGGAPDAAPAARVGEVHAQFGATASWTIGVDAYQTAGETEDWTGIAFARRHLWTSSDGDVFSAEMGLGYLSTPEDGARARLRPGLSWGRGFDGAWGAGWLALDASAEVLTTAGDAIYKADFTAGVRTDSGLMLIMQVQTDRNRNGDVAARLAPSAVFQLNDGVRMQFSVAAGVVNDTSASVKIGTWLEF